MPSKRRKPNPIDEAFEQEYGTPAGLKCCTRCNHEYPATDEHYDVDNSKPDGFKTHCKKCRNDRLKDMRLERAAGVLETLDKSMMEALTQARPGGSNVPHQAEMYQVLMSMMGGVQGWGMHWMAQYLASAPGSQTRERMLGQMQKMAAAVSDSNKVAMPAEMMSDEDLDIELRKREDRMRVIHAEFTDPENNAREAG